MAKLYLGETEIAPIVEVPTPEVKYGATIGGILGNINAQGVYSQPTETFTLDLSAMKSIASGVTFRYKFYKTPITGDVKIGLTNITTGSLFENAFYNCPKSFSVDLSSLTEITGASAFNYTFYASGITSLNLSGLTSVTGASAFTRACAQSQQLTSVDLSNLEVIDGASAFYGIVQGCPKLTSINLNSLRSVNGNNVMLECFLKTGLTSMSFPALEEILPVNNQTQFSNMFLDCPNLTEVHFPTAMQERIEQLNTYSTKFGATNATIYFDL